jgi:hypothetical protein
VDVGNQARTEVQVTPPAAEAPDGLSVATTQPTSASNIALAAIEAVREAFVRGIQGAVEGNGNAKHRVSVIGTEGSGKTTFITALAKQIDDRIPSGWLLDPRNMSTQQYVDRAWEQLRRGDWPQFTLQAALHELDWRLEVPNTGNTELRLVDASGHRFRELFTGDLKDVPGHLADLAQYCRLADVVVVLINMQDFIGEADAELRSHNELALKFAFDYVREAGPHKCCCAVFTQTDLYPDLAARHGGWNGVAQAHLPRVWGAHFRDGQVPVFDVAAVDRTEVRVDEQGTPRRFPAKDFQPRGYALLLDWLQFSLTRLNERHFWNDVIYRLRALSVPIGLLGVLLFTVIWFFSWLNRPRPEFSPGGRHDSTPVSSQVAVKGILFDTYQHQFKVYNDVANKGGTGKIRMVVTWWRGDKSGTVPVEQLVESGRVAQFSSLTGWLPDDDGLQSVWRSE